MQNYSVENPFFEKEDMGVKVKKEIYMQSADHRLAKNTVLNFMYEKKLMAETTVDYILIL